MEAVPDDICCLPCSGIHCLYSLDRHVNKTIINRYLFGTSRRRFGFCNLSDSPNFVFLVYIDYVLVYFLVGNPVRSVLLLIVRTVTLFDSVLVCMMIPWCNISIK